MVESSQGTRVENLLDRRTRRILIDRQLAVEISCGSTAATYTNLCLTICILPQPMSCRDFVPPQSNLGRLSDLAQQPLLYILRQALHSEARVLHTFSRLWYGLDTMVAEQCSQGADNFCLRKSFPGTDKSAISPREEMRGSVRREVFLFKT